MRSASLCDGWWRTPPWTDDGGAGRDRRGVSAPAVRPSGLASAAALGASLHPDLSASASLPPALRRGAAPPSAAALSRDGSDPGLLRRGRGRRLRDRRPV